MDQRFKYIKVIIWDFDGTLYRPIPKLWQEVREAEYKTIMKHTGWPRDKTIVEFERLHHKKYPSATETVAKLSRITISQSAIESENYFDRWKYVQRDEKLISLLAKLKNFRHLILANGVVKKHRETLKVLGIPADTFELIVTSETVGVTKPHPAGFRYILEYTSLPPAQHLMIGDREKVDLEPAKKLGMETCLVWSEVPSEIADVTLPTVYDIANILT